MTQLFAQIIFALMMLSLGIAALLFPDEIYSGVLKVIGEKRELFNLIDSTQTRWSIRLGGGIAILIGFFVLWMSWRHY